MNRKSLPQPAIIIEADGKGIRKCAPGEKLPEGTFVTSDYHLHKQSSRGAGKKAFKLITTAGHLLYGIKP